MPPTDSDEGDEKDQGEIGPEESLSVRASDELECLAFSRVSFTETYDEMLRRMADTFGYGRDFDVDVDKESDDGDEGDATREREGEKREDGRHPHKSSLEKRKKIGNIFHLGSSESVSSSSSSSSSQNGRKTPENIPLERLSIDEMNGTKLRVVKSGGNSGLIGIDVEDKRGHRRKGGTNPKPYAVSNVEAMPENALDVRVCYLSSALVVNSRSA